MLPVAPASAANDALPRLYLLPGAPRELAACVYERLTRGLEGQVADPAVRARIETLRSAYATVAASADSAAPLAQPPRDRSPWQTLHVAPDAPAEVVEVAYRYWRRRSARLPVARHLPPVPPSPSSSPSLPSPPSSDAAAAYANVDERLAALAVPRGEVAVTANGVPASARADATAWLVAESGARFAIGDRPLRIGSDPTCDVVTSTNGARPAEARLWSQRGRFLLHGLEGAQAGVLVNGTSVTWAVLEDGDSIEIGGARFRFEAGASVTSEEA